MNEIILITAAHAPWRAHFSDCVSLLSEGERKRAEAMRALGSKESFVLTRALLRMVLSKNLGCHPSDLNFETGDHGKPKLIGADLNFNVSHTDGMTLIALGKTPPLGVDIERLKPRKDLARLARYVLDDGEYETWARLPVNERAVTFVRIWTLKEAFLKATGEGLQGGLKSISIDLQKSRLQAIPERHGDPKDWPSVVFEKSQYQGALVYAGPIRPHCLMDLLPETKARCLSRIGEGERNDP